MKYDPPILGALWALIWFAGAAAFLCELGRLLLPSWNARSASTGAVVALTASLLCYVEFQFIPKGFHQPWQIVWIDAVAASRQSAVVASAWLAIAAAARMRGATRGGPSALQNAWLVGAAAIATGLWAIFTAIEVKLTVSGLWSGTVDDGESIRMSELVTSYGHTAFAAFGVACVVGLTMMFEALALSAFRRGSAAEEV